MKNIKKIIFLFAIILLSNSLIAQIDRSIRPEPGPAPEFKIKESQTFTLDNGLQVIVVENHKVPRISYQLILDVNPVWQKDAVGYVSFTGNLLRTGTKTKTKAEIDEAVDFIGANLNTSENFIYGLTLTKYKKEFLEIFSDVLLNPTFPEEELEKNKKQTLSELAATKTSPEIIADRVGQKLRNANHPYSEIVTEQTVENITRDLLVQYYNTYYKPNVSYLVIVGDISLKDAKKDVERYFGAWEKSQVPKKEYQFPNKTVGTRVAIVHKDDAVQSSINITYPVNLKVGDKDAITAMLANNILGGGSFSAKLLSNLREDKGYTYGAYSSLVKDPLVGYFSATAQVGTEVTDDAVNQFIIEMNNMRDKPIKDETLDLFKNIQIGSFSRGLEKPERIARYAYNTIRYDLPKDYYQTYLEKIESVSKNQIQEVSKKYIDPEQAIIVVVGDKNKILEPLKKYSSSGKVEIYDVNGNPLKEEKKKIPEGLTAQKVIDKYIDAIGGKENLEKIEDVTIEATTEMNGMEITQKTYRKAPDKFAMIMSMNGNVMMQQLFDGEHAIMKSMQGEKEIVGDDLENLKVEATLNAELKYNELGVTLSLEGIETIEGKDAYKVKIENPTGQTLYDYFDVESGLKVQTKQIIETPQGNFTQLQIYLDYREINGVKYPFKIKIQGMQNMELKIKSVDMNTGLNDDLFQ